MFRETNQIIGGVAPSSYLKRLKSELDAYGEAQGSAIDLGQVLSTHHIDVTLLEADAFDAFYDARKEALAKLIELKTGLKVVRSDTGEHDDGSGDVDSVVGELEPEAVAAE